MNRRGMRRPLAAVTGVVLGLSTLPMTAVVSAAEETPTGLFFSEYVEGSSSNKALEVYNGTGDTVDLSAYTVRLYSNGSTSVQSSYTPSGTLAAGDVFVIVNSQATEVLRDASDVTSAVTNYNGDDTITLSRGAEVVDVIGQLGVDPGDHWESGGVSTQDMTLRRKQSVTSGDPDGTDAFDPAVEWDGYPQDTFDDLGRHGEPTDVPPTVERVEPGNNNSGVATSEDVRVTFSEDVTATGAFGLVCDGDPVAFDLTDGGEVWTLDPQPGLPSGATCLLTVEGAEVLDEDGDPDPLAQNVTSRFFTADCAAPYTAAYAIQGSGAETAMGGGYRSTRGVVVGDYEKASGLGGFYLQDLEGDGDPATSDAVFVYTDYEDHVELGDVVLVRGRVSEYFGQTQVDAFSNAVEICGGGASVEPADVAMPFDDEADRERYEGMLVALPDALTVTETYFLGRFGQVTLSSDGKLPQPTNVVEPGPEAAALQARNERNRILLDDGTNAQNPDPVVFGRDGEELTADNTLRSGDVAHDVVGVMTYTWGGNGSSPNAFRVRPVGALGGSYDFEAVNERPAAPDEVGGDVRVASFNVLNYFNTFRGCRGGVAGEAMDCRGADNTAELERQAAKIVAALEGLDADVVGLVEIENDGYAADSAIADLTRRLNGRVGADTYRYLDVDGRTGQVDALGDDAIKVGMLYKPGVVVPNGETAVLNTDSFVNGGTSSPKNRPALAQTFLDRATGERFTTAVNHLKSKGSECGEGNDDPQQGSCNLTRARAAQELADWLATSPTGIKEPDALIMGDLNAYAEEDPIAVLEEAGFEDLVRKFEGEDAYSYVFDGQWGYLDHALASPSMAGQVTGTTTWHINADEPSALDYDMSFKSSRADKVLYAPSPYRSSDHDPVLVGLDLGS